MKNSKVAIGYTLTLLAYFTFFRALLYFMNMSQASSDINLIKLFLHGLYRDFNLVALLLFVPTIFLILFSFFPKRILTKLFKATIICLTLPSLLIASADLSFFRVLKSRINNSLFSWLEETPGIAFSIGLEETSYWLIPCIILFTFTTTIVFIFSQLNKIISDKYDRKDIKSLFVIAIIFLLTLTIKTPYDIKQGTIFPNSIFSDQISRNAVISLLTSQSHTEDTPITDTSNAFNYMKKYFGIASSAFERNITFEEDQNNYNVVIILMESMAAHKTGFIGGTKYTPFLDSLAKEGLAFTNAYSVGTHTYNGIYSTLFSLPSAYSYHPLKGEIQKKIHALPSTLKDNNYETLFMCTLDPSFDNMQGFMLANGYNRIISEKDYDQKYVQNSFGVPDHILFKYAIDSFNKARKPFFASLLTISDHLPYVIPKNIDFKPNASDINFQIIEYADWSLKRFFEEAKKTDWYENTLFVILADHGSPKTSKYEISLPYHHIPLIFYMPSKIEPKIVDRLTSQIDVFPIIMDFLKTPYSNKTLGQNTLNKPRKYLPLSNDNAISVMTDKYLYTNSKLTGERLEKLVDTEEEASLNDFKEFTFNFFEVGRALRTQQ